MNNERTSERTYHDSIHFTCISNYPELDDFGPTLLSSDLHEQSRRKIDSLPGHTYYCSPKITTHLPPRSPSAAVEPFSENVSTSSRQSAPTNCANDPGPIFMSNFVPTTNFKKVEEYHTYSLKIVLNLLLLIAVWVLQPLEIRNRRIMQKATRGPGLLAHCPPRALVMVSPVAVSKIFSIWLTIIPGVGAAAASKDGPTILVNQKSTTDPSDVEALRALKAEWGLPASLQTWQGGDPCSDNWHGVICHSIAPPSSGPNSDTSDASWSHSVTALALAERDLEGSIPDAIGNLKNLQKLDLSRNKLKGRINPAIFAIPKLNILMLGHNELEGRIPYQIRYARNLTVISMPFNKLRGKIPREITFLRRLKRILIHNNMLHGRIPRLPSFLTHLEEVNFSNNNFSQTLPWQLSQVPRLVSLAVSGNRINGSIPPQLGRLSQLKVLRINNNELSGPIPSSLGQCTSLIVLLMENNKLTGQVPSSLSFIPHLRLFSVSNNSLSGIISSNFSRFPPSSFAGNPELCVNDGSFVCPGSTPDAGVLDRYHPPPPQEERRERRRWGVGVWVVLAGVVGTLLLLALLAFCVWAIRSNFGRRKSGGWEYAGKIKSFPDIAAFRSHAYDPDEVDSYDMKNVHASYREVGPFKGIGGGGGGGGGGVIGVGVGGEAVGVGPASSLPPISVALGQNLSMAAAASLARKFGGTLQMVQKHVLLQLTHSELQSATNNFHPQNVVSTDGTSRTFSGVLADGTYVAVKEINLTCEAPVERFLAAVESFAYMRHPNLVHVLGFCAEDSFRYLVYELVPNGSLDLHLHDIEPGVSALHWHTRMSIAFGLAKGLAFLHSMSPQMTHERLESTNVVLEDNFEAKLIDYCPSILSDASPSQSSSPDTRTDAGRGGAAPELAWSGEHTARTDMFSFGVLLLELLSGRRPLDSRRPVNEQSLVRWAKPRLMERSLVEGMVDPNLGSEFSSAALYQVALLASKCVQTDPETRPTIFQAVEVLAKVQNLPLDSELSSSKLIAASNGAYLEGEVDKDV